MGVDIEDKIVGSFLGLAVGDALGAPVEGAKPGAIRSAYKTLRDYADPEKMLARAKLYRWRKPGLYTDDTQQALVLLDSLLQDRGLQPEKAADRFVSLAQGAEFHFGVYRGTGRNFRLTVTDLRQGKPWTESGRDTSGNGAAMRVAPVALYYYENLSMMADAVARASILTHRNPLGISAATGVAYIIARFLQIEDMEPAMSQGLVVDAADFCREQELMLEERYSMYFPADYESRLHLFSGTLRELADRLADSPDSVGAWISSNADPYASNTIKRPTLGFALASVVYSIYITVSHTTDFESAVIAAVNSGGDTDTIGAMVGSMSGALHGVSAIPDRWLQGLANRKQLKARAEALASKKWMKSKMEDLYEMEYGLTNREHEERLARMRKAGVEFPDKKKKQKFSEPEPIKEKFDAKKFKRQQQRMKEWMRYLPPDSPERK